MHIVMIGSGYVGLVSGACLADFGHHVVCVDKDESKIARLQSGQIPIYEPGLEDLVARNVDAGRLTFSTDLGDPVRGADVVFIAVGTPARRWACRPFLCLCRGRRDRAVPGGLHRRGHQVDGSGWNRR